MKKNTIYIDVTPENTSAKPSKRHILSVTGDDGAENIWAAGSQGEMCLLGGLIATRLRLLLIC